MNRNVLILAALVVIAGIAAGLLLAGNLSPGTLEGALFDDIPGPWLYATYSVVGDPGLEQLGSWQSDSADALLVVEQRHEQLPASAGGTVGVDCYIVAPLNFGPGRNPSFNSQYYLFSGRRADLLILADSVEAAPGVLKGVASSNPDPAYRQTYVGGCVPVGQGVPVTVANADLVGRTVVRNSDVPWRCNDGIDSTGSNVGYHVVGMATVASGGKQMNVFQVRPGNSGIYGGWVYWDEKTLNAPVDYLRANFHPI